jgi:hypothetical protein
MQDARTWLAHRFDGRIARIDHRETVNTKTVFPHSRFDRAGSNLPNAVVVFGHRHATVRPLSGDHDFRGLGCAKAKRDAAIGGHFRGLH